MSSAQQKSNLRMIVASFAAGAGAMAIVGLAAPLARDMATREALAAPMEQAAVALQPLDVVAVRAQLVGAAQHMQSTRAATTSAMNRLERLSGQ